MENENLLSVIRVERYIEWNVKTPECFKSRISSKTFSLQNKICELHFTTGSWEGYPAYLSFKCNGDLQLPITVTLHVLMDFETDKRDISTTITITSPNQNIWGYNDDLTKRHMTFELIFHANYSRDEKSVQTPSYLDTRFLVDNISPNFTKMLDEGPCHDLEFICGEQTMKAHKAILSCRSDVFASMLESDMVEGKTGRVTIKDMDAALFREFVRYLYTGILPALTVDIAIQYYKAGEKYNISTLKKQCADFLADKLTPENAYDTLIFADRHNDLDFKKNVQDYMIKEQMPFAGENWSNFCKMNPILANEILNLFCQHLRVK